jgi:hypothetical protein
MCPPRISFTVIDGLVPAIHEAGPVINAAWITGTSPGDDIGDENPLLGLRRRVFLLADLRLFAERGGRFSQHKAGRLRTGMKFS